MTLGLCGRHCVVKQFALTLSAVVVVAVLHWFDGIVEILQTGAYADLTVLVLVALTSSVAGFVLARSIGSYVVLERPILQKAIAFALSAAFSIGVMFLIVALLAHFVTGH